MGQDAEYEGGNDDQDDLRDDSLPDENDTPIAHVRNGVRNGHNVVRNIVVADIATDPNEGIGVMRAFIDLEIGVALQCPRSFRRPSSIFKSVQTFWDRQNLHIMCYMLVHLTFMLLHLTGYMLLLPFLIVG